LTLWAVLISAICGGTVSMAVSIVIDYSRSRVLYRAAKAHNSQALEADALHFSTDIWSSSVVILGLVCVAVSKMSPGLAFLAKADAVAAALVALIVIYVSSELGMRTIQGLLDTAPDGMTEQIKSAVEAIPGVIDCHQVRARYSGPTLFVDAHVLVDGGQTLSEAHHLTEQIESVIREVIPGADVTIHPEPVNQ
jgi:cation diffusion facilitator family transporter